MQNQSCKKLKQKKGAYIILSLYLIIALLAAVGLAIDFAHMYLKRLELQKALQNAVTAGLEDRLSRDAVCEIPANSGVFVDAYAPTKSLHTSTGDNDCTNKFLSGILVTLKAALKANLGRQYDELFTDDGTPFDSYTGNDFYTPYIGENPADIITLSLSLNVKTLLVGSIPFDIFGLKNGFGQMVVGATATGEIKPANIVLVLDTSGSMACPAAANDCKLTSDLKMMCAGGTKLCDIYAAGGRAGTKIQALSSAVTAFLQKFRSGKDSIKVVPFQLFATVLDETAESIPALIGKVRRLPASGLTNTSDALATAIETFLDKDFKMLPKAQFILFSDGPPTAGRFMMPAGNVTLPPPVTASDPNSTKISTRGFSDWAFQKANPGIVDLYRKQNLDRFKHNDELRGNGSFDINMSPWELGGFYDRSLKPNKDDISAVVGKVEVVDITSYKLAKKGADPMFFPGPLIYTPMLYPYDAGTVSVLRKIKTIAGDSDKWEWSDPSGLSQVFKFTPSCSYVFQSDATPFKNAFCHNDTDDLNDASTWNPTITASDLHGCDFSTSPGNYMSFFLSTRAKCIFGDLTMSQIPACTASGCCPAPYPTPASAENTQMNSWINSTITNLNPTSDPIPAGYMQKCFNSTPGITNGFEYFNVNHIAAKLRGDTPSDKMDLPPTMATAASDLTVETLTQKYYTSTIQFADHARSLGATIHTIGLGASTNPGDPNAACNTLNSAADPYQTAMDDFQRKDIFLGRIANTKLVSFVQITSGATTWTPCYRTTDQWTMTEANNPITLTQNKGYSIATDNPAALKPVFLQLARKILLSLTPAAAAP